MISLRFVIAAAAMTGLAGIAQADPTESPVVGVWATEGGNSHVQIHECEGEERLCGTLIWSQGGSGKRLGTKLLKNFDVEGEGVWEDGEIVDPRDGSAYRAELELKSAEELKVRGCWFIFCRGQTWTRVSTRQARIDPEEYEPDIGDRRQEGR